MSQKPIRETKSTPRLSRFRGEPILVLGWASMGTWLVLRIVLGLAFGGRSGVTFSELARALVLGAWNDAVVLLYVLLPLTLVRVLAPNRLRRSRLWPWAVFAFSWGALFLLLYLSVTEYFFFEEFDSRFNLVAVDYLIYPHEVLINIWDSYPIPTVLATVFLVSAFLTKLLLPELSALRATEAGWRRRVAPLAICLVALGVVSFLPSRWSYAGLDNRAANEIAANGVASFFEALDTNEIDYYTYYPTGDTEAMFRLLTRHLEAGGAHFTHLAEHRLDRRFPGRSELTSFHERGDRGSSPVFAAGRPLAGPRFAALRTPSVPAAVEPPSVNVVVIVEESFGAEFLGAYGATSGLSPEFDALAEKGMLFTHAYATGTRTVRGLEAIMASFPPIPSVSIVRRPGNEGIATWGKVMLERGYHASFLYGGFSYFDNMQYFFSHNGFDVSDRTDVAETSFSNIWGVCDEDLFRHALAYFDGVSRRGKPFFSVVLTTSNHKPFTFPPGVPGVPEEGGGRQAGIRYADYALGRFFDEAEQHEWFDRTLFVVVGDHGARVYGAAEVPVASYEIPILFYAPDRLGPARVETPTSQIDVAPTVLGLLGRSYEAPFFGQNVLAANNGEPRALLLSHNHDVALLRGRDMVVLGLHKQVRGFRLDQDRHGLTPAPPDRRLADLATAFYQVAYDQFQSGTYR